MELQIFQSTPPVKAATPYRFLCWDFCWISIHAAREGGDDSINRCADSIAISIHAAREGGDGCPMAGRKRRTISIHAAREGGD